MTERLESTKIGRIVLAVVILVGIAVCLVLAKPFLSALTWALALAILFAPVHARIEMKLKHPSSAALVSVLVIVVGVALPAIFVVGQLIQEAAMSASLLQARVAGDAFQHFLEIHPSIAPIGTWMQQQIDLSALITSVATWLSSAVASLARGSALQILDIVLTFYLLFYFLRDRRIAKRSLREWLPLTDVECKQLFDRVVDTVKATIYGTLFVAAVQGFLGGLMFWLLSLPTPRFWGLVMGLLSIVPVLGAFVVWIPTAVFLVLDGSWGKALILTFWGALVVGGIDNILRPMFVGSRLRLHTVPAFISTVGGLILFGAPGFILGPLAVTITSCWWKSGTAAEQSNGLS
jgi:predicted PurR-regulated permease PerM